MSKPFQTDEFIIEAVDLRKLTKVVVGHDDSGPGSGWFLDKVTVCPDTHGGNMSVFPCQRWLATDEDDGLVVRELHEQGSPQLLNS